jgi:putative addiction module component (TIGR02574 family)
MDTKELHNLERKEKIRLVQLLWDDIANDKSYTYVSKEHKQILDERLTRLEEVKAGYKTLEEIREKFNAIR